MEFITFHDGNKMPVVGAGFYQVKSADCERIICAAIDAGYRSFDTANAYFNEVAIGSAIKNSCVDREDIFITSKLWPSDYSADRTSDAIDATLKRLNTDYLDLLLLHQEYGNYTEAWKSMEMAVKDGRVKSIGLSNFRIEKICEIIDAADILPVVNQIQCHPYNQQLEMGKFLEEYNIALEAYCPLGHGDASLFEEPIFKEIAENYGKTVVQIILKWHLQERHIVIPKASSQNHMAENIDIFDFELSRGDMERIRTLNRAYRYFYRPDEEQEKIALTWAPDFNAQQ